ncbi:MAG: ATPase, T2SS/T4P/T4SS family, partial [Candidatus Diapherotrites archaeon]|nr:ATPase, T2SS/T4P/T4SS family [Candidatus Diapherotrites archaeon]
MLAAFIPDRERIITIEDTAELNLPIKHWIRLEARPPGLEGTGELKIDILTKNSLRMRPDRIIVGEIRHEEAFTLFTALNTGHDGALAKNTLIQLSNGNITEIETLADKYFKKNTPIKESDYEFVEINDELFVPSMNKTTLKMENRKVTRIWRKKAETKLIKIKLKSGKEIMLTKDHPIYKIQNGIQEINSCDAKENEWIAIPRKISVGSEERIMEPHLLGLIYGDGHVGQEGVEFVNKEKSVINFFNEASRRITQNKITEKDYGTYYRTKFFDKKIVKKLNDEYNIPIGNKTKTFKIQEKILATNPLELSKLIQGLYDCEAHVNNKANCIQFSTSNPDLAKKLPLILQRYGIMTSTYAQAMDGKGNYGPYYRISLYGKENILLFSEKIGFGHDRKKEKLLQLISRAKQSIDVFPNIERIMRDARSENKMTRKELSALLGTNTTSTINAYETKARNPTREQLHKISEIIKTPLGGQLKILAESELKFERIILVSEENYTGYVYDLTVEGNHNYIANGLVVSNCLGTVHANSPEETIVRLTSPPMNVPSIMLSGLDLIVVEHRYYDRKKGTLRRI